MPMFYFDTSAIVKRYRAEQGSVIVDALLGSPHPGDLFCVSQLAVLEVTSAFVRLASSKQVEPSLAGEALAQFRDDLRELFRTWPLRDDIIAIALTVVERYRLRAGDVIHLATAVAITSLEPGAAGVMVSSDHELLRASTSTGLAVLDPADSKASARLRELRRLRP